MIDLYNRNLLNFFLAMSESMSSGTNLSSGTIKGFFRFGKRTTVLLEFNHDIDMFDIYGHIYGSFNDIAPSHFHVEFYSSTKRKMLCIDDNLLQSPDNPFYPSATDNNNGDIANIMDYLELFIIDDSPSNDQIDSNTVIDQFALNELEGALCDTHSHDDIDYTVLSPPAILPNTTNEFKKKKFIITISYYSYISK